jgi:EAL domain-containing protein (putative c-di-GMP-specific phosphodiesterase class I)
MEWEGMNPNPPLAGNLPRQRVAPVAPEPDPVDWSSADLHHAVESDQITLHYQPVVSLTGGGVRGAEALLRWRHPHLGTLNAGNFLAAATRCGALSRLLPQVINDACHTAAAWRRQSGGHRFIAINIDPHQFASEPVIDMVLSGLKSSGASPEALVIEVTERADQSHDRATIGAAQRLQKVGVGIALDDFGTGHSSLARLREMPAQTLKIDKQFVQGVTTDASDRIIVASITQLAAGLNIDSVAEGIETASQAKALADLGCKAGQGFLWSEAVPAAQILQLSSSTALA